MSNDEGENTKRISIHALRKESDPWTGGMPQRPNSFQSTLSVRRATTAAKRTAKRIEISIHALRKESDLTADVSPFPLLY